MTAPPKASAQLLRVPARPAPAAFAAPLVPAKVAAKPAPVKSALVLAPAPQAVRAAAVPRPHPPLLASVNSPAREPLHIASAVLVHRFASLSLPNTPKKNGWYAVSGWIALAEQSSAQKPTLIRANPLWIKVDGHPVSRLASGQWAALPAGTHQVTFQPPAGMGVGPKTWSISIAPSAHLTQQVPLPPAPLPDIPTHLRNP